MASHATPHGLWLLLPVLTLGCPADPDDTDTNATTQATTSTSGATSTTSATTQTTTSTTSATSTSGTTTTIGGSTADGGSSGDDAGPPKLDVLIPDAGGPPPLIPTDIDVVLTADNAYAFGYGTENEMLNYFGGVTATLASQIFNCADGPEQYLVPADDVAEYLYIVAYGDTATTQGVIGQFRRLSDSGGMDGDVLYTGDEDFEVCATGVDYNGGDPPPTLEVINQQITLCNGGMTDPATTSGGWVDIVGTPLGALAVGETNETPYAGGPQPGNEFPLVCQSLVDEEARWMWFNWDPAAIMWPMQSPFIYPGGGGNPMHDFMIFRLASEAVPPPPAG